jgi:hypothetical protein
MIDHLSLFLHSIVALIETNFEKDVTTMLDTTTYQSESTDTMTTSQEQLSSSDMIMFNITDYSHHVDSTANPMNVQHTNSFSDNLEISTSESLMSQPSQQFDLDNQTTAVTSSFTSTSYRVSDRIDHDVSSVQTETSSIENIDEVSTAISLLSMMKIDDFIT